MVQAESLRTVASESGFPLWQACGTASVGRVLIEEGNWEHGDALMREGIAQARDAGVQLNYLYPTAIRTEGCILHRKIAEGLRSVDELFEGMDRTDMRMLESEINRMHGELILLDGKDHSEVEKLYRTALSIAQAQGAKSWELRAALSLARLVIQQDRRDDARAILDPVYGWFTEGFDTADLKDAKALLDELSGLP
jgi:predicted ATPase